MTHQASLCKPNQASAVYAVWGGLHWWKKLPNKNKFMVWQVSVIPAGQPMAVLPNPTPTHTFQQGLSRLYIMGLLKILRPNAHAFSTWIMNLNHKLIPKSSLTVYIKNIPPMAVIYTMPSKQLAQDFMVLMPSQLSLMMHQIKWSSHAWGARC